MGALKGQESMFCKAQCLGVKWPCNPHHKKPTRDTCVLFTEPCWFSEPPLQALVTLPLAVLWFFSPFDGPISDLIFPYALCSAHHLFLTSFLLGLLFNLEDELACSSKILAFFQTTWHYIPEETLIVQIA
jgi:hypothetical protein